MQSIHPSIHVVVYTLSFVLHRVGIAQRRHAPQSHGTWLLCDAQVALHSQCIAMAQRRIHGESCAACVGESTHMVLAFRSCAAVGALSSCKSTIVLFPSAQSNAARLGRMGVLLDSPE